MQVKGGRHTGTVLRLIPCRCLIDTKQATGGDAGGRRGGAVQRVLLTLAHRMPVLTILNIRIIFGISLVTLQCL